MQQKLKKIAILAGGGPAPGINSVIASATIRATLSGIEVLGIKDGFRHIMERKTDAKTTSRWYFVVAMGRKVGHLALGIGKAAGATLTVIPEEFSGKVPLKTIVDIVLGAMLKRLAHGADDGVAVLAEGLADGIDRKDLEETGAAFVFDDHGHIRL